MTQNSIKAKNYIDRNALSNHKYGVKYKINLKDSSGGIYEYS